MAIGRQIGRGTRVFIIPLRNGDEGVTPAVTPTVPITFTTGASAITKGAVSVTGTTAFAGSQVIPAGTYLEAVAPSGKSVMIKVTADTTVSSATVAIPVIATAAAIPSGSTITYPLRLRQRKTADITRQIATADVSDFDTAGFALAIQTLITQGLKLDGDYAALDPAYNTIEYCANNFQKVYAWVVFPNPDITVYTSGKIIAGQYALSDAPLTVPNDNIITSSLTLKLDGVPVVTEPLPT